MSVDDKIIPAIQLPMPLQTKLAELRIELERAVKAERSASWHWEIERDAVKTTLQQLEHEQSRSREQSVGLAQAHAEAAVSSVDQIMMMYP